MLVASIIGVLVVKAREDEDPMHALTAVQCGPRCWPRRVRGRDVLAAESGRPSAAWWHSRCAA